jgi:hypothetical protein
MEPWIQPTTAPHQPDLGDADDREVVQEGAPRVERGWMESPQPSTEAWVVRSRDSIALTAFTVAVVLGFLVMVMVAFPFLLLATY